MGGRLILGPAEPHPQFMAWLQGEGSQPLASKRQQLLAASWTLRLVRNASLPSRAVRYEADAR